MRNLTRQCFSAVVVLLATIMAACGAAAGGAAGGAIPWLDIPGTPLTAPAIVAQRLCGAADLQLRAAAVGAYQGRVTQEVLIRSTARDACFFAGPPLGAVTVGSGSQLSVTAAPGTVHRLDLAPGETARLVMGTPAICPGVGHPKVASSIRLSVGVVQGAWVNVECGPPVVMLFEADVSAPTGTDQASGLMAVLSAPGSVSRGTILVYQVTLSNPTASSIAFDACPSYTEWLGTPPTVVKRTLQLNCGAARTIVAGQSFAFEMKVEVPEAMEPGPTKLNWSLEVRGGPAAGAILAVD